MVRRHQSSPKLLLAVKRYGILDKKIGPLWTGSCCFWESTIRLRLSKALATPDNPTLHALLGATTSRIDDGALGSSVMLAPFLRQVENDLAVLQMQFREQCELLDMLAWRIDVPRYRKFRHLTPSVWWDNLEARTRWPVTEPVLTTRWPVKEPVLTKKEHGVLFPVRP